MASRICDLFMQVVVAFFDLDRLVFILQRLVEIDFIGEVVAGGFVPALPVILIEPAYLPVNAGFDDVVYLDRNFEGHGNLVPASE